MKKHLNYGEDCLSKSEKKIILSDKEFNDGIHSDGVSNDCFARLAKRLGYFDDDNDYDAFQQNLAIIAMNETGKDWFVSEGLELF